MQHCSHSFQVMNLAVKTYLNWCAYNKKFIIPQVFVDIDASKDQKMMMHLSERIVADTTMGVITAVISYSMKLFSLIYFNIQF